MAVRTSFKLAKYSELEVETIKMMRVAPEKSRKKLLREKETKSICKHKGF